MSELKDLKLDGEIKLEKSIKFTQIKNYKIFETEIEDLELEPLRLEKDREFLLIILDEDLLDFYFTCKFKNNQLSIITLAQVCEVQARRILSKYDYIGFYEFIKNYNNYITTDVQYGMLLKYFKFFGNNTEVINYFTLSNTFKIQSNMNTSKSEQFNSEKNLQDSIFKVLEFESEDVEEYVKINTGQADLIIENEIVELKKGKLKYSDMFQVIQYIIENEFSGATLLGHGIQHQGILKLAKKFNISILTYGTSKIDDIIYSFKLNRVNDVKNKSSEIMIESVNLESLNVSYKIIGSFDEKYNKVLQQAIKELPKAN